jgi:hypothetical protein
VFRPAQRDGAIIGMIAGGLAVLLGLVLLVRNIFRGVTFATFGGDVLILLLFLLGGIVLYWSYALYELRYVVDDNALTIIWGLTRVVIPVGRIERIVLGRRYGEPRLSGISWPGYHVGRARVARLGEVVMFSTHRTPAEIVYVMTAELTFGLSLGDPQGLARSVQSAQEALSSDSGPAEAAYSVLPAQDLLRDPIALALLAASLLVFLFAAGYIYARFQALPLHLPIDYPPTAGPQRIGERGELLRLPLTALIWLIIGTAVAAWSHGRLRIVCYTVLIGTLFAECLYAIAALAAAH